MTVKSTVSVFVLFVFSMILCHEGKGQVNLSLSKRNLGIEKARSLFEIGQYENAQLLIEGIIKLPGVNGIISKKDNEELQFMHVVCGLVRGEFASVQGAKQLLLTAETKSITVQLAYFLGQYYFGLSLYTEAIDFLEMTDVLFISNEQNETVQFEKGVSYFSQKKFDNASPYFKSLYQLKNSKYHADLTYYLGFISFAEKKYNEALEYFLSIKEEAKYKNVLLFYLSFIYHEKANYELALNYGEIYLKSGDALHEKEMLQLLASIYFNNTIYDNFRCISRFYVIFSLLSAFLNFFRS
jgi:tetratricopeptide (TPR) repeat protein